MNVSDAQPQRPLEAVILAAGKGTRMGSDLPKVLHPVGGRAMVQWVVDACEAVGVRRTVVIVGHEAQMVRRELGARRNIHFVEQTQQLGTGHAVRQAESLYKGVDADALVLCGDGPLIRPQTLTKLLETHRTERASATLATAVLENQRGYGRIIRDGAGRFQRIVEEKEASESQKAIREVNPSYYCFRSPDLFAVLSRVTNANAKGEYYLTDVPELLLKEHKTVAVVNAVPPEDVLSINTPEELAEVDGVMRARLATCGSRPATQRFEPQAATRKTQASFGGVHS